ncbi:MAG: hypothetical protein O3A78_05810 [Nitrospinae bacterium]|jgi:hypothetical protein|nr:hypothetical protein [Nitrospinota bacterium]MDA1109320.1 hypothetical protein [Nitrospinota bacterium]
MKKIPYIIVLLFWLGVIPASAGSGHEYQLYKNNEDFGIVVFPKENIFVELEEFFKSIVFEKLDSGKAVMRYGSKGENETFMMPLEIQKKYSIEKFMVIQVMTPSRMLIGVFDPEWGLTLPSSVFDLEGMKINIPKTLDVFRGGNSRKEIFWNGSLIPNDQVPHLN